jgi:hypothetical protein
VSATKIKRLRQLVKELTRGSCMEHPLHIPPDYEQDADLVIGWAADHIEVLEKIVSGKTSFTRNGITYRVQPVERRTGGRRTKDY